MSAHTPGPWVENDDDGVIHGADGVPVCEVTAPGPSKADLATAQANAALIAAAPGLQAEVERLKENERIDRRNIVSLSESERELTEEVERLRAALADQNQPCDGINCDKGEECVRLSRELAAERERHHATVERIYPCAQCGTMRTKAEGGTTFTVCDVCWDAAVPAYAQVGKPAPTYSADDLRKVAEAGFDDGVRCMNWLRLSDAQRVCHRAFIIDAIIAKVVG